jgi:hypothetical protein
MRLNAPFTGTYQNAQLTGDSESPDRLPNYSLVSGQASSQAETTRLRSTLIIQRESPTAAARTTRLTSLPSGPVRAFATGTATEEAARSAPQSAFISSACITDRSVESGIVLQSRRYLPSGRPSRRRDEAVCRRRVQKPEHFNAVFRIHAFAGKRILTGATNRLDISAF